MIGPHLSSCEEAIIPAGENFGEIALEWVTLCVYDPSFSSSMLCKQQTHWLPRLDLARSHLLSHWCRRKRCLLSPQENVQTTVVFCPRSSKRMYDIWGLLPFPRTCTRSSPHWVVILKVTESIQEKLSKGKMNIVLERKLRFSKATVFWKQRRETHRLLLGPPSLVYSVLFLLMNPASVVTWCLPPHRYACWEINTASFYGHGCLLQSR